MKNFILFTGFCSLMLSCQKNEVNSFVEKPESLRFQECFAGKTLPILPKQEEYIEGEIDGKSFSISSNTNLQVTSNIGSFYKGGFKSVFNQGNSQTIRFSVDGDLKKSQSDYFYNLIVNFPSFQGDEQAYAQYFDQFQKGKTFELIRNGVGGYYDRRKLGTINFDMVLYGCSNEPIMPNSDVQFSTNLISSLTGDNFDSNYCRVADVQEVKLPNGVVSKRVVTLEFDVVLGIQNGVSKRIRNGRLSFSY